MPGGVAGFIRIRLHSLEVLSGSLGYAWDYSGALSGRYGHSGTRGFTLLRLVVATSIRFRLGSLRRA